MLLPDMLGEKRRPGSPGYFYMDCFGKGAEYI